MNSSNLELLWKELATWKVDQYILCINSQMYSNQSEVEAGYGKGHNKQDDLFQPLHSQGLQVMEDTVTHLARNKPFSFEKKPTII